MGAIATGGVRVMNEEVLALVPVPDATVAAVAAREQEELERRERLYRGGAPAPEVRGRTVILVDDGLATGSSMRAAAAAVRNQGPAELVVAVPVAAPEVCAALEADVDRVVCLETPESFMAVGLWYEDFAQTTDEEVRDLVERAAREREGR
jgi:putative phosphoribosyl transferase